MERRKAGFEFDSRTIPKIEQKHKCSHYHPDPRNSFTGFNQ